MHESYATCNDPDDSHQEETKPKDPLEDRLMATRKDIKKAEELRISQIGDFKFRLGGIQELPSGLIVKIKNPGGLKAFLASGTLPNSLMVMINEGISKGRATAPEVVKSDGTIDTELMKDMETLLNEIAIQCIVEPEIHPVPLTEADRSDEMLYADEIPQDDKQFLLQWITGGTRDLEKFRLKQQQSLDTVAQVAGAQGVALMRTRPDAG